MDLKKTVKYDGKIKGLHIVEGQLIDGNGEVVNLVNVLFKAYGETPFDLSTTTKIEEIIDLDEIEEVDIEDLEYDEDEDV